MGISAIFALLLASGIPNASISFDGPAACVETPMFEHGVSELNGVTRTQFALSDKIAETLLVLPDGKWALALSNTEGVSCFIMTGTDWYVQGKDAAQ